MDLLPEDTSRKRLSRRRVRIASDRQGSSIRKLIYEYEYIYSYTSEKQRGWTKSLVLCLLSMSDPNGILPLMRMYRLILLKYYQLLWTKCSNAWVFVACLSFKPPQPANHKSSVFCSQYYDYSKYHDCSKP